METKEYKEYQKAFMAGLCPFCHAPFVSATKKTQGNVTSHHFQCQNGHIHHEVLFKESIKVWNMLKIKQKGEDKKVKIKLKTGSEISGDPRYPKGVEKYMKVDKVNDWYDQVVTDLNTGDIVHEEHEPLSNHK